MSLSTANNTNSYALGDTGDLTGLTAPFSIVIHFDITAAGAFLNIGGLRDSGDIFYDPLDIEIDDTNLRVYFGKLGAGTENFTHSTTVADNTAGIGWDSVYVIVDSGNQIRVGWRGVEDTFSPTGPDKDFWNNLAGPLQGKVGQPSLGAVDIAHYAIFDHALSAGEVAKVPTHTPNNLGGAQPVVYQKFDTSLNDGVGGAWTDNDGGNPVVFDGGNNPSLTAPSPTNPVFTAGPTAVAIGETTVSAQGTSDLDAQAQVVVVASGAGQPSDATFDASSFNQYITGGVQFSVPVTGLTGLTNYDLWVRLKPTVGTSSYGSDAFTTTPAAPTITSVNGGNPIVQGASYIITGSGFTGHTAADIDGATQTGFTVDNDNQVTITASVRPNTLRYTDTGTFNIGGTTTSVTMLPQAGWDYVDITSVSGSGTIITSPVIAVGDQVTWDTQSDVIEILPDATVAMTSFIASTSGEVHDTAEWGGVGTLNFQLVSSTTPDQFTFTDVAGSELSTVTESNEITVTGITEAVAISITGGEYAVNTGAGFGAFTSTASTVSAGHIVKVRVTSSPSYNTEVFCTLNISGVTDDFNVTTRVADTTPDQFTFTDVADSELGIQHVSNSITVTGVDSGINIPISITGGEYSVNGGAWTSIATNLLINNTVRVRNTSSGSYATDVDTILQIGNTSDTFRISTRAADTAPDPFTFTDVTGQEPNVYIVSNTITVAGVDSGVNVPVSISGEANSQYAVNGGAWTSTAGNVQLGDTLQVRAITTQFNASIFCTLDIGGVTDDFNVTTRVADTTPDAFTFTDATDVEINTVTESNVITVEGIDIGVNVAISIDNGGEYSVNGGAYTTDAGVVQLNDAVRARLISSSSYNTGLNTTLDIGGVTDVFTVTTRIADTVPDAFTFTDQNNVPLSTLVTSNTITVTGVDVGVNVPISVTGGEYSVNGGTYTSIAGNVQVNDLITVRHTSSSSGSIVVNTTLDIGGITDIFSSTTIAVVTATLTDILVTDNNNTPYTTAGVKFWVLNSTNNTIVDFGTVNPSANGTIIISDTSIVAGTIYKLILQSSDNTIVAVKEVTAV
jgi:hypothetical protein